MVKLTVSVAVVAVIAIAGAASVQKGCRDATTSFTRLEYSPIRDMRHTVVINPQKVSLRGPDSLAVPMNGREWMPRQDDLMANREAIGTRFSSTVAADDSSLARGGRMFTRLCTPCHGKAMAGDGPVAAKFMPPPDLMGATTRGRSDGYIYTYIRYGGAIMPKYGHALTIDQTWDVVHYLRSQQKVHPR